MQGIHNWVVKVSKLCNLRCRYCYEWEDLAKTDRVSLDDWRTLLQNVRTYHEARLRPIGGVHETRIIWHGGEPLLLPTSYMEEVMKLEREILGAHDLSSAGYQNQIQTNLYSLSDDKLAFLEREKFQVGVSMDVVAGIRLTAGGASTEERVAENLDRLAQRDIPYGVIVVLAGHTADKITRIYDFYASLPVDLKFLPLFAAPLNTPEASFALSPAMTAKALNRVFVRWIQDEDRVDVDPLRRYLYTIYLRLIGAIQPIYDRRINGDWAFIVNTNGDLYLDMDAYEPQKALGNVFRESIDTILASDSYEQSLLRDGEMLTAYCDRCEFKGACSCLPLFEARWTEYSKARCPITYPVLRFMERYVLEKGYGAGDLEAIVFPERR
jgi:uncharacterized protein